MAASRQSEIPWGTIGALVAVLAGLASLVQFVLNPMREDIQDLQQTRVSIGVFERMRETDQEQSRRMDQLEEQIAVKVDREGFQKLFDYVNERDQQIRLEVDEMRRIRNGIAK